MKNIIRFAFCAGSLSFLPGCILAVEADMAAVPIKVEAYVHDSEGKPVEGAVVHLSLPRYRPGDRNQWADAQTDSKGITVVSGIAQQDYVVGADKTGYYHTTGPHRGIDTDTGRRRYAKGVQKIDLELRPIRAPVQGIVRYVNRLHLPKSADPIGFDLEVGDWVAPFGKGKTTDFLFNLSGYIHSNRDYDFKLTLSFKNPADGVRLATYPPRIGSAFKFPYEAPLVGYEQSRVWSSAYDGKTMKMNFGPNDETNYIFRVRSEPDEKGGIRRALYGVIVGEVFLGGGFESGQTVSFTYALNPDWTRNIEFDPEKLAAIRR